MGDFAYTFEFTEDWFVCPLRDSCVEEKSLGTGEILPNMNEKSPRISEKSPHNTPQLLPEESRTLRKLTQPNTTVLVREGLLLNQIHGTTVTCFADCCEWNGE